MTFATSKGIEATAVSLRWPSMVYRARTSNAYCPGLGNNMCTFSWWSIPSSLHEGEDDRNILRHGHRGLNPLPCTTQRSAVAWPQQLHQSFSSGLA